MQYTGDPINGFVADIRQQDLAVSRDRRRRSGPQRGDGADRRAERPGRQAGQPGATPANPPSSRVTDRVRRPRRRPAIRRARALAARAARPQTDPTLQDPRCVFQIVRRHFARYTPEMVERVDRLPQETFLQVAETLAANSGPERTSSFCYADRLDPAHLRRPDHRGGGAAPAAARQHGTAGRRDHGAARPRHHPGLHRHPDAVPLDPRLHAGAVRAEATRRP